MLREFFGVETIFDPAKTFVRSDIVSPLALAAARALISLYCFTTVIAGYTWQAYHLSHLELQDLNIPEYLVIANDVAIGRSFSYFTWLCFWSQSFYFFVSSIHGFMYSRRGRTWLHGDFSISLRLLHSLWYSTIITFPFLVSIVFWGTMMAAWPSGRYEQWLNLSVHGLNSSFALFEIWVPSIQRPPVSHLALMLAILSLYLGLAYLTKLTQDFYVYEWMNPVHGNLSIILHILAYATGVCTIFTIASFMLVLKHRLFADHVCNSTFVGGDAWKNNTHLSMDTNRCPTRRQWYGTTLSDMTIVERGYRIDSKSLRHMKAYQ